MGESLLDELVAGFDYPMLVVTTTAGEELAGCLVGFTTQTSIDPPRFVVWLSVKNRTFEVAARAGFLAVHVPGEDDRELAELFGGETGDEVDKFERCRWHPGPEGLPILEGVSGWFAGRVLARLDGHGGDHAGFLLEPIAGARLDDRPPLRFQQARSIEPGHEA